MLRSFGSQNWRFLLHRGTAKQATSATIIVAEAAIVPTGTSGTTFRKCLQMKRHNARNIHGHPVADADTVYSPSEVAKTVPTYCCVST